MSNLEDLNFYEENFYEENLNKIDNIVFLDIDGVLNDMNQPCTYKFKEESIDVLNYLYKKYNINIVISSSWREAYTFAFLQKLLKDNGILAPIIDKTNVFFKEKEDINCVSLEEIENLKDDISNIYSRDYEILDWLKRFKPKHFLILDDFKMSNPLLFKHQIVTKYWSYNQNDLALNKNQIDLCEYILELEEVEW